MVQIAKTVSEHYEDEDEEVKNTFVSLVLQLYVDNFLLESFPSAVAVCISKGGHDDSNAILWL